MIDLRNDINRKDIPEKENPKNVAHIVEKILDFNKQQEGKGLCKVSDRERIKILTPKQILQRLPIALVQVKTGNTSTIFMNSKNSGTSDPHRLLLNLTDKTNIKRSDKYVTLSTYCYQ